MGAKAVILVVVTMMMVVLACEARSPQKIGSVQLINAVGEKVIIPQCNGPDGDKRGPAFINFPGSESFQFQVNVFSTGWRCTFEYVSKAEGNRKYTADVLVWEGVFHSNEAPELHGSRKTAQYVPCFDCIWKIQRDGFYRADDKNHESFRLMTRWN